MSSVASAAGSPSFIVASPLTGLSPAQLIWSNYAELKHIYTAIWGCRSGFTNATHRCKLVSLQDFRNVAGGPVTATSATDHNALSNRGAAFSHPIASVYGVVGGAIPFHSAASSGLAESGDFMWDAANGRLGIGTATPSAKLHVEGGGGYFSGDVSALTFTDRTPYPKDLNLAIVSVMSMERLPPNEYDENNKEKQLDHAKLHDYLKAQDGMYRDASATISCQNEVIKYLLRRQNAIIEALEKHGIKVKVKADGKKWYQFWKGRQI